MADIEQFRSHAGCDLALKSLILGLGFRSDSVMHLVEQCFGRLLVSQGVPDPNLLGLAFSVALQPLQLCFLDSAAEVAGFCVRRTFIPPGVEGRVETDDLPAPLDDAPDH